MLSHCLRSMEPENVVIGNDIIFDVVFTLAEWQCLSINDPLSFRRLSSSSQKLCTLEKRTCVDCVSSLRCSLRSPHSLSSLEWTDFSVRECPFS